jgi:ribosomal protein L24
MTFAQYHAIKQNPELARFIMMINDEAAIAVDEVNMKYRNLKAESKEKQLQLTHEIAIAKQRIAELKNTVSELESAVKKPKEKGVAKSWKYKGNQYYRDGDNNVWRQTIGGCEFVGVYIEEEDRIDEDVNEPFDESDDE